MKNRPVSGGRIDSFFRFLREKFDLADDNAAQNEVIENIGRGVEFRGTNLWILIFATLVASLGLNVNSTAVIIGAMLISPLMGPIMGIGLSLGINDFDLMKRSVRNFTFMIAVSILTSTCYFLISPLSNAQSELLARTTPTTYDVLIAFFGGMAGIVAQSRRDRTSTVIPGVAIATALMPPLCTAGFGLATGQFRYFIGAFYLFFINTVFIALATYLMVVFLDYEKHTFIDKARERRVKRYMILIATVTLVPSVILGVRIVRRTTFEANVDRYVASVFRFNRTTVIDYTKRYRVDGRESRIDLLLMGEPLDEDVIAGIEAQLPQYGLENTRLAIRQADGSERVDFSVLQAGYAEIIEEKNRRIDELRERLAAATVSADTIPVARLSREAGFVCSGVAGMGLSRQIVYDADGRPCDTAVVCLIRPESEAARVDTARLRSWLAFRTETDNIRIFIEKKRPMR